MAVNDAVIAVIVLGLLIAPFAVLRLWWWVGFLGALAVVTAIFEGLAAWRTGRTLSQQFWAFRARRPRAAWGLVVLLAAAWVGLLIHLTWK